MTGTLPVNFTHIVPYKAVFLSPPHLTIMTRWMSSIIGLITTWSAIRLVYWLDHTPTAAGVLEFIIPLVLLPLLASSYAEVNYEGAKIIQVSVGCCDDEGIMAIFRASSRLRAECSHSSICMVTRSVTCIDSLMLTL